MVTKKGREKREFTATIELGYTYGGGGNGGVRVQILDATSRVHLMEFRVPIEEWGVLVRGTAGVDAVAELWDNSDLIGKVYEHRTIVVPTIRSADDYEQAEGLAYAWLRENEPSTWWDGSWTLDVPRGDGSTRGNGFNRHRLSDDGYELTVWRYVDPEFPLDSDGKPLAWPDPATAGWYVDAWNGLYPTRDAAIAESKDWTADESTRVLSFGEPAVSSGEFERRTATT